MVKYKIAQVFPKVAQKVATVVFTKEWSFFTLFQKDLINLGNFLKKI